MNQMDRTDLEEIQRFLAMMVGQPDLYTYLKIDFNCETEDIENAVRRRRSWAQGQQANPKYRNEALWIIKNIQLMRAALIEYRDEYLEELRTQRETEALEALTRFTLKRLKEGILPQQDEASVYAKGEELGLSSDLVRHRIDAIESVEAQGLITHADEDDAPADNHYATLGAAPGDDLDTLESAYRERYRWARNLRDTEESSRIYADLDEAWRVLKDPDRRAEYDADQGYGASSEESATSATTSSTDNSEEDHIGYLPPPTDEPDNDLPEIEHPEVTLTVEDDPSEEELESQSKPDAVEEEDPLFAAMAEAARASEEPEPLDSAMEETSEPSAEGQTEATVGDETSAPPVTAADHDDEDDQILDIGGHEGASLEVVGDHHYRIRTGQQPYPIHITIKNTGTGPMAGSLTCEQAWVSVSPPFLNPNRPDHKIEILIDPDQMPGNAGQAVVEFNMDHGESETIIIDAVKHLVSPVLLLTVLLALLGIAGLIGGIYFSGVLGSAPKAPPRTILTVQVDPPAGEVFINDKLVGKQGTLSLVDSFPIGRTFQVRVELDGFEPWTKEATVPRGQQIRIEAELTLRDTMQFQITPTMRAAEIEPKTIRHRLEQHEQSFNHCFTKHLRTESAYMASVVAQCVVSSRGFIARVSYKAANFSSPDVQQCLTRQLRALELPVIPADYAIFEHTFRARVSPTRMQTPSVEQVQADEQ